MKVINTFNFVKLSGATGDDQFPSYKSRHDDEPQGQAIFAPNSDSALDTKEKIEDKWKKKKKKKDKKEKFPEGSL